ncbi:MAG: hypothetical protein LLG37_05210 [Spirochaetia bacterium]|nr:hypothetical protein [Spirochaetia bacterium]
MKRFIKELLVLCFTLFVGFNIVANRYLKPFVHRYAPDADYLFAVSVLPDRYALFGFNYMNITARCAAVDLNLGNIYRRSYDRAVDGIMIEGFKMRFVKKTGVKKIEQKPSSRAFIIPFCKYVWIMNGTIEYEDFTQKSFFSLSHINGISKYKGKSRDEEFLTLDCTGRVNGRQGQKVYLNFHFYPYYTNRFFLNVFATGIDARMFEPLFRKNNIKIDSGRINFIVQIDCLMRRILVNNIMQFEKIKLRENTGLDVKALFGLSVEQLTDFLKDSKGDFYVNFEFDIDDADFPELFRIYGDKFAGSIIDRVKQGVVTAPIRQIKDLLWNVTGGGIIRVLDRMTGKQQ